MSTAYPYQIEGCTSEYSSEINGYIFTRTLILTDVTGISTDADIIQAFNALTDSAVQGIGTDLSDVDFDLTGCWMRNIKVNPIGNNQWRVVMQYQHSPFNQVDKLQVATQTQVNQVESNKDKDGTAIKTRYLYPLTYGGTEPTQAQEKLRGAYSDPQGGTFSKLVPESTRTYTVREDNDGDAQARSYVGKVNSALWQSGAAGTWMLSSVTGATDDSLQTPQEWVNSYTFQYRSDGWQPKVIHTDELTNEPVPDPVTQYTAVTTYTSVASIVNVTAYETALFTDLFAATDP